MIDDLLSLKYEFNVNRTNDMEMAFLTFLMDCRINVDDYDIRITKFVRGQKRKSVTRSFNLSTVNLETICNSIETIELKYTLNYDNISKIYVPTISFFDSIDIQTDEYFFTIAEHAYFYKLQFDACYDAENKDYIPNITYAILYAITDAKQTKFFAASTEFHRLLYFTLCQRNINTKVIVDVSVCSGYYLYFLKFMDPRIHKYFCYDNTTLVFCQRSPHLIDKCFDDITKLDINDYNWYSHLDFKFGIQ